MGNIHGVNTSVIVDGFDLSFALTKASIERIKDLVETTTFQSTAKSRTAGLVDGKFSGDGYWDGTAVSGPDARADAQMNGAQVCACLGVNKTLVGVSNRAVFGISRQAVYKTNNPLGGVIGFSLDFEADG